MMVVPRNEASQVAPRLNGPSAPEVLVTRFGAPLCAQLRAVGNIGEQTTADHCASKGEMLFRIHI